MILGANPETVALVNAARELGVYTVVTDYDHHAYAKNFADKAHDVDGMDVPSLIALARAEGVDGVLVGVADRLIVPYQHVCEALGMPCYATPEQCAIFTNKSSTNDALNTGFSRFLHSISAATSPRMIWRGCVSPCSSSPLTATPGKG